MVSERQRLARKKFKEANPGLFPKPEPTPPKDPDSMSKKKKSKFKPKKKDFKGPKTENKSNKPSFRKHPLRVPGMKPGESCFICKAQDHIAKHCPEKAQWEKNKICLNCRRRGHSMKNCPNKSDDIDDQKLCYNCGEAGHALSKCPQPLQDGGTKFASCFICNERGHLSKNCPKNTHGIYPKGGSCKICGGITHLAKDCPNKRNLTSNVANGVGSIRAVAFYLNPGFFYKIPKREMDTGRYREIKFGLYKAINKLVPEEVEHDQIKLDLRKYAEAAGLLGSQSAIRQRGKIQPANEYEGKPRVTKFASGDDLDDDFMTEDVNNGDKNTSAWSENNSASLGVQIEKNIVVKPKKQGPKVVNFLG